MSDVSFSDETTTIAEKIVDDVLTSSWSTLPPIWRAKRGRPQVDASWSKPNNTRAAPTFEDNPITVRFRKRKKITLRTKFALFGLSHKNWWTRIWHRALIVDILRNVASSGCGNWRWSNHGLLCTDATRLSKSRCSHLRSRRDICCT
jgi:hypothetical protein